MIKKRGMPARMLSCILLLALHAAAGESGTPIQIFVDNNSASSTLSDDLPLGNVIDRDYSTCFATENDKSPYVRVRFDDNQSQNKTFKVGKVVIQNLYQGIVSMGKSLDNRLIGNINNTIVIVRIPDKTNRKCDEIEFNSTDLSEDGQRYTVDCGGFEGYGIRIIQRNTNKSLILCEVEAYEHVADALTPTTGPASTIPQSPTFTTAMPITPDLGKLIDCWL